MAAQERPMKERFDYAVSVIRSLPKDGPFQPSNMMKLKFYGLYKQATLGTNNTPKPGFWDPTARAKWEAWTLCKDMNSTEAMRMYIKELEQIVETMPQTKEVEGFLKMIGPFYNVVEDEENSNQTTQTTNTTSAVLVTPDAETTIPPPPGPVGAVTSKDGNSMVPAVATDGSASTTATTPPPPATTTSRQPVVTAEDQGSNKEDSSSASISQSVVDSDDDEDVEFQDSYDDLPGRTSQTVSGNVRLIPNKSNSDSPPSPLPPSRSVVYHTSSSPSVITPLNSSLLEAGEADQYDDVRSTRRKEVRFMDPLTTTTGYKPPLSSDLHSSPAEIIDKMHELQQKLQMLLQQFNSSITIQQSASVPAVHHPHTRRRRISALAVFRQVLPLIAVLITSFFYHLSTGSTMIPWWVTSLVTACSTFLSALSLFL